MRFAARSTSSAPVTTRRRLRSLRHFSASASSRQDAGTSGNDSRCTDAAAGSRASHASSAVKHSIGASQVTVQRNRWSSTVRQALARQRGIRIAIERVLADVEIERRQVDVMNALSAAKMRL